jgi:hypothetical protein
VRISAERLKRGRKEWADATRCARQLEQPGRRECLAPLDGIRHGQRNAPVVGGGKRGSKRQAFGSTLTHAEMERIFGRAREERISRRRSWERAFGHADDIHTFEGKAGHGLNGTDQDPVPETADRPSVALERVLQDDEEKCQRGARVSLEYVGLAELQQCAVNIFGEGSLVGLPSGNATAQVSPQTIRPGDEVSPGGTVNWGIEVLAKQDNVGAQGVREVRFVAQRTRGRCVVLRLALIGEFLLTGGVVVETRQPLVRASYHIGSSGQTIPRRAGQAGPSKRRSVDPAENGLADEVALTNLEQAEERLAWAAFGQHAAFQGGPGQAGEG